jgi:hypothetical protein
LFDAQGNANLATTKSFLMGLKSANNAIKQDEQEYAGQMFKMDLAESRFNTKLYDYYV